MRRDVKTCEKYCAYCGKKLERKTFNGRREDFGVFQRRKYCDRECMRKSFVKKGLNNQNYSCAHASARKLNDLILHREKCDVCGNEGKIDIHHIDGNYQNNDEKNLIALCRSCHMKIHRPKKMCIICGDPVKGLGYCNKHYIRYKKYGDPLYTKRSNTE